MAKKDINIFGTSFLDLLSGALAAVIILFVIVPKATPHDMKLLEKVQELESVVEDIDQTIDIIKNSVPKEILEKIENQMSKLEEKMAEMTSKLKELEDYAKKIETENLALRQKVEEQQEQINSLEEEIETLKRELQQTQKRAEEEKRQNTTANTVEKTLGVFAKFGILCRWSETDCDVDMGVQRFGANPEQCWWKWPSKPWGILGEDVRERDHDEEERFELFYVPKINPDVYTFWINVYEKSKGSVATVSCTMIFHPGKTDEQRQEFPLQKISSGQNNTCVATFQLTETGFSILPHREPLWGNVPSYK